MPPKIQHPCHENVSLSSFVTPPFSQRCADACGREVACHFFFLVPSGKTPASRHPLLFCYTNFKDYSQLAPAGAATQPVSHAPVGASPTVSHRDRLFCCVAGQSCSRWGRPDGEQGRTSKALRWPGLLGAYRAEDFQSEPSRELFAGRSPMTPETFCEQFATFAEAPYGVAKLRKPIQPLAACVHHLLTPR